MFAIARSALALLAAAGIAACGPGTKSEAEFTREYADAIRAANPSTQVRITKNLELRMADSAGNDVIAYLDNAYRAHLQSPADSAETLRRYVAATLATQANAKAKVDRTRIVPVVKDRAWLDETAQATKGRGKPMEHVVEPINDQLVILYAEDSPSNIRYLTPKDLEEAGVDRAELRELALANLRRLLPKVEIHTGPVISMITAGGDYEASLLLFRNIWSDPGLKVEGDIVVAIPARDLLMVTGTRTPGGVERLRAAATKARREATYGLTDALFVYRNGTFTKLD
jgi:uncharacterized protein YtpQ (UPF0354 family)